MQRNFLKIVIIGFFFGRDIEQKISENEKRRKFLLKNISPLVYESMNSLREQLEGVKKSNTYLSRNDEDQWLASFRSFETDLSYLRSINTLEESHYSAMLLEIGKFRHIISDHNNELEKNELRQILLKYKDEILEAEKEFNSLLVSQQYFSKKRLKTWKDKWSYMKEPIQKSTRNRVTDLDFQDSIAKIIEVYQKGEQLVEKRNLEFIEKELAAFKELFDTIESYPLTNEQRKAIVVDENNNLVVAGAGTGKTSTIIGKAVYLIKKGLATPENTLLIAFNRDIASEMNERIHPQLGIRLKVKTYHSLGLEIIAESEGVKPSVSELAGDRIKLPNKILQFIKNRMKDESFSKLINQYFLFNSTPYRTMFEFNSHGEYIEYLKRFDIRSLKGDRVKSLEECDIANFLYVNGITYEYERSYDIKTVEILYRQYKPDFFLPEYGIYIEHFGIDRNGRTAPFIPQREYDKGIQWKRTIHKQHKTTLIETYSYEKHNGELLNNLEQKLHEQGVTFRPIPDKQIFDRLNEMGKVSPLSLLLSTFLNLYKSCGKSLDEIRPNIDHKDTRTSIFLDIFAKIYDDYNAYLKETEEIDFNDMISSTTTLINNKTYASRFKYILVDEFQDISQSRYRFLKALLDQNDATLFCVGDDWQSIYRFTGSDLAIMLEFEKHFGFSETTLLTETFRFNNKLCEFSTKFILQNPNQIKKTLISKDREDKPAVTVIIDKTENVLTDLIDEIDQKCGDGEDIFIIGRYNNLEPKNLNEIAKAHPKLTIKYTTAHSSKGLEADYVILLGLTTGEYGFPCQIMDDPLLNLVLAKQDPFANAEERRLFYVSITRAKKHVYLVADDSYRYSTFISEIQQNGYEITISGEGEKTQSCPLCKTGKIVLRTGEYGEFHSCSNYPYCEYVPKKCPTCQGGFLYRKASKYLCSNDTCSFNAEACPACNGGYLVLRKSRHGPFYGCSNYPKCNYIKRTSTREMRGYVSKK